MYESLDVASTAPELSWLRFAVMLRSHRCQPSVMQLIFSLSQKKFNGCIASSTSVMSGLTDVSQFGVNKETRCRNVCGLKTDDPGCMGRERRFTPYRSNDDRSG
jgi:hypothetical protein